MSDNTKVLSLEGSMTVDRCEDVKKQITDLLGTHGQVILNLNRVERIDLAFVQVMYAAKREAEELGKELHLHGSLQKEVSDTFLYAGLTREGCMDARVLESHLIEFSEPQKGEPQKETGTA
jgi:anti-anti-sigma regulatory factor